MDLENLAVSAVKESIALTDTMSPFISDGDKEPVWDGHIYIYADKSKKKENIKKVPVQVKGKKTKNLKKDVINYSLGVPYLKDYLDDGGVFFFVVCISPSGKKKQIYYASLLPIKLRILLSDIKDNQKTKSFELRQFPTDNDRKTMILLNFYENMQKQTSFRHAKLLSQEDLFQQGKLESITFTVMGYGKRPNDIRDLLFEVDDLYLYANIKGAAIPQPLEEIPDSLRLDEIIHNDISVKGEKYYSKFHRTKSKGQIELTFGRSVRIIMIEKDHKLSINFKPASILEDALVDIPFILSIAENYVIEIGGNPIILDGIKSLFPEQRINDLFSILEYYRRLEKIFDALHMKKNYDIACFSEEDHMNSARLFDALFEGKQISGLRKDIPYVALIDYADTKLLLVFKPTEHPGTYEIADFFSDNTYELFRMGENGERITASKYMNLTADNFLEIGNIDYADIIDSFRNYIDEPYCAEDATQLLLQIIHAYDKSQDKRTDVLEQAENMAKWIMEEENLDVDPIVKKLNYLQIQKRKRALTEEEMRELVCIAESSNDKQGIYYKIGANLLLDNQMAAEFSFNKLSNEEKEQFRQYPIWRFSKFQTTELR